MLRPFRGKFVWFFILSAAGMTFYTATPYIAAKLIDALVAHKAMTDIWQLIGFFIAARLLDEWLWRLGELVVWSFLPQLHESVRTALFDNVLKKPHDFFVNTSSGQIGYWINSATDMVRDVIENFIWAIWVNIFSFIVVFIFLAITSWQLAVIFAVWLITLVIVLYVRGKRQATMVAYRSEATSVVSGRVVDAVANHLPVRIFNAQNSEVNELKPFQQESIRRYRRAWLYGTWTNAFKGNSAAIVSGVALALTVYLYTQGQVSVGSIALFVTYISSASETIWALSAELDSLIRNFGTLKNAIENLLTDKPERSGGHDLKTDKLAITFNNVQFAYPDQPERAVLHDLSFTVAAGEHVGIVGHSGAGKSTIVSLLLGLHEPTGGELSFNGNNIADLSLASIRQNCAYVPQDTSLFNRTVRDNIVYGAGKVDDEALQMAASRAQALDFIKQLPKGFDSLVGERGVKLSGGQRQRIAITRAMLSHAPLVLLDEATSALDSVSEQRIQAALAEVMKNRSAIVIAHRLSTLKHLDRILVMDGGTVAETGTHDELIVHNGIYADLWRRQKDGFLGN